MDTSSLSKRQRRKQRKWQRKQAAEENLDSSDDSKLQDWLDVSSKEIAVANAKKEPAKKELTKNQKRKLKRKMKKEQNQMSVDIAEEEDEEEQEEPKRVPEIIVFDDPAQRKKKVKRESTVHVSSNKVVTHSRQNVRAMVLSWI